MTFQDDSCDIVGVTEAQVVNKTSPVFHMLLIPLFKIEFRSVFEEKKC